jgi:hypothetical protein
MVAGKYYEAHGNGRTYPFQFRIEIASASKGTGEVIGGAPKGLKVTLPEFR